MNRKAYGLSRTKIYLIYNNMIRRCNPDKKEKNPCYAGRGITVCDQWADKEFGFLNFYLWSNNNKWEEGLTLDRIDVDGNYEPSNCRWATMKEQANNRRNTFYVEYKGEKITISECMERSGLSYITIYNRIKRGYFEGELLSNTRERREHECIVKKKSGNYEVAVAGKYLGVFKNVEEAELARDRYRNEPQS